MTSLRPAHVLLAVSLVVALAGCGTATRTSPPTVMEGGDAPTTARALAFVAAEHVGEPNSAEREHDAAEEFTSNAVGTELRYGPDGDMLVVAVGRGLRADALDCASEANQFLAGCEETDAGLLLWEDEVPEEDPGGVYLVVEKGESAALLFYSGPSITADPRTLDMPVSVETLFEIANDPRVDVTTSQAAVDAGADLPFWRRVG